MMAARALLAACPQCGRDLQVADDGSAVCSECNLAPAAVQRDRVPVSFYLRRFPATTVLLAMNVLVFVAMCMNRVSPISPSVEQLLRWGANSGEQVLLNNQWWRLMSSAFVHVGILHLLMNMWALWLIGTLAEAILGKYLYVGVYLLCALAGSLT